MSTSLANCNITQMKLLVHYLYKLQHTPYTIQEFLGMIIVMWVTTNNGNAREDGSKLYSILSHMSDTDRGRTRTVAFFKSRFHKTSEILHAYKKL